MFNKHLLAAALCTLAAISAAPAEAQIVIGGRGRLLAIPGPGISIRIGPGIGLGGYRGLPYAAPYLAPRGRIVAGGAYGPPARPPAPPTEPAVLSMPTEADLAALTDSDLLNAVLQLSGQLDADLNRFTSAASWQRYFRLPDDALPPPQNGRVTLGARSLAATQAKFDSVAANPNFAQIFSLPSFAATRMALTETNRRFGGAAAIAPPANPLPPQESKSFDGEELPAPPPTVAAPASAAATPSLVAPSNRDVAERSILSK